MADLDKWTFATTADGDIAWDYDRNRPKTIEDEPAVKQDLLVALASHEGDDPLDEEFGLDLFRAVRHTDTLRQEITRTLEYDDYRHDRVDSVTNIDVVREPPGSRNATVHVTARLDSGQPLQLVFDLFRGTVNANPVSESF